MPKVKITSLEESRKGQQLIGEERVGTHVTGSEGKASNIDIFQISKQLLEIANNFSRKLYTAFENNFEVIVGLPLCVSPMLLVCRTDV